MRMLRDGGREAIGLDRRPSPFTDVVGSIGDRACVQEALSGVGGVVHTATLHKPHVETHSRQAFIDTNVVGTTTVLEEAVAAGVASFVFTSTTSAFGRALVPPPGEPAAWITEDTSPIPKNVYGATKAAAEDLCRLVHQDHGLPCVVLRTSRFFPEEDDRPAIRDAYSSENAKANEYLYRRVDLADAVDAHLRALERAPAIGFGRYIVTATTPFEERHLRGLREDAPGIVASLFPTFEAEYARRDWSMFPTIERVYVNERARTELGWRPVHDFGHVLECLCNDRDPRSDLARAVGSKGYHADPRRERLP